MPEGVLRAVKTAAIEPVVPGSRRSRLFGDFAELVKARLTMLVLLTTAVGFYLGARGPVDLAGAVSRRFRHGPGRRRRGCPQPMVGAPARCAHAAHEGAADSFRSNAPARRAHRRQRCSPSPASFILRCLQLAERAPRGGDHRHLHFCLHAAEKNQHDEHLSRGDARCFAADDRLGRGVRESLEPAAWSLFAILFCWQMPHFFAIAWMYREDYARGGFQMLSRDDDTGVRSASQSVLFCMLLLIIHRHAFLRRPNECSVSAGRAGARSLVYCHGDGVSPPEDAPGARAQLFHHLDHLSPAPAARAGAHQIMNAVSVPGVVPFRHARSRGKLSCSVFPSWSRRSSFLFWRGQVNQLAQPVRSTRYGTIPPFQLAESRRPAVRHRLSWTERSGLPISFSRVVPGPVR